LPAVLVSAWAIANGCAVKQVRLGDVPEGGALGALDAAPDVAPSVPMCIGTECPPPYATCVGPGEAAYTCATDLARDPNNCGSCGNACPDGQSCNAGACGCPKGREACPAVSGSTICVDLRTDDANCGACGVRCEVPGDACSPPSSTYGCVAGSCGRVKCEKGRVDCNGDLGKVDCASDGCEVGGKADRDNCGGCGIACKDGEECLDPKGTGFACVPACGTPGITSCPGGKCVDLTTDVDACGGCDHPCPAGGPNQVRACKQGLCALECAPGFTDCNGDPSDGCETNTSADPNHCGACNHACDVAAGQPCIEGKCLMVPCGSPGTE